MKQIVGVLVLAGTIGLAIAATSSASTDNTGTSCAAVEAAINADAAAALKAARAGDAVTDLRLAKEVTALAATAKTVCAGSNNTPAEFSSSGLPPATLGKPYPPTTFCAHLTRTGNQCNDASGKLITFETEGDLLPLGMRFDSFNGTVSGTPRIGQGTRPVHLRVCWHELLQPCTHWTDATLIIK